jgi:transposase-like protein
MTNMTTPRKKYSPAFKAQIVQELLKEEQTLTQIASRHGVHPSQLRRWREAALTAMPANFADEAQFQKHLAAITEQHDREKEKLYAEIGKLTTQLNWLKKKAESVGISTEPDEPGRTRRK